MKINTKRDSELVKRANAGDQSAFRQLVFLYKDYALSLVRSILKDPVRSEDVLQDAFIKVFKNLKTFKFNAAFSTWLYRIVVNTSYNELKRNKPFIALEATTAESLKIEAKQLTEADQKKYINLVLDQMKPDEALVLRLHYLNELKIKEIEAITDFSTSKIKVSLHRGRENFHSKLKRLLGKDIKHLL